MHYRPITPTDQRGAIISLSQPAAHGGGPINYAMCTAGGVERRARDEAREDLERAERDLRRAECDPRMRRGLEAEVAIARRKYEAARDAYEAATEAHFGF